MWAHYADQFSGICVGYSLSRMLASLGNDVEFVRMYYDEKVPTISHASAHPTLTAKRVLSYKNYRWLYEREWRMFATQGKAIYGEAACATHIYLGSRMRQVDRELVIESLKDTEIRISEMSIKKYSISFIDV
jgi:hypothetical protein